MPQATSKQIFISYSHRDTRWHHELVRSLMPYLRDASISSWSDEQITPGSEWFEEIKSALRNTKVAVLLVTPNFLKSDFILEHELGPLLKEAEKGGVKILWVPARASAYKKTALTNYQAVLDPDKPLADMTKAKRDRAWLKICDAIEAAIMPVGALTPTADTSNIVTSNAPVPIRFWIKQLPEVPGEDATKLFSNALGSWQAVVVTPMRKADSEAEANVIILTSSETIAVAQVGPPTSESSPLTIRFGSTVSWTPHTFEAASNRMIGHILGLTYTNTPGQMMSERATLESLPLVPQPEDIKRIRQIWGK